MRLDKELRDPLTIVIGVIAGGAAAAVGIVPVAAAGVGAAVWGVKAFADALMDRDSDEGFVARLLPIRGGSPEERWVRRAERASRSFRDLSGSVRPGPVAQKCMTIGDQAHTTIEAMKRLAGQASAVSLALKHLDATKLAGEQERLQKEIQATKRGEVRDELERSLASIREQRAVHERLEQAGRTLLARMESGTIGLEGLVARLAEVLAMAETAAAPGTETQKIDQLADELDGLRTGLAETEDLSRRALSAYHERAS